MLMNQAAKTAAHRILSQSFEYMDVATKSCYPFNEMAQCT